MAIILNVVLRDGSSFSLQKGRLHGEGGNISKGWMGGRNQHNSTNGYSKPTKLRMFMLAVLREHFEA